MKYSIDRMEEGVAVCEGEDGNRAHIPLSSLWDGAREGDMFAWDGTTAVFLPEETAAVRHKNSLLLQGLFEEE